MSSGRRSIDVAGLGHGTNPTPTASRIGNIVFTGGVSGIDVETQSMPENGAEQCANMFSNLLRVLDAAGASADDVIMLTIYAKDRALSPVLNERWQAMFPDASARPARHVLVYDGLPGGMVIQCQAVVVLT